MFRGSIGRGGGCRGGMFRREAGHPNAQAAPERGIRNGRELACARALRVHRNFPPPPPPLTRCLPFAPSPAAAAPTPSPPMPATRPATLPGPSWRHGLREAPTRALGEESASRTVASCCGLLTTVFGFASDRAAASHRRPPTASDCVWSNGGSSLGRFCRKGNPPGLGVADGAQTLEFRLVCAPEYVPFQNLLELHVSVRETAWLEASRPLRFPEEPDEPGRDRQVLQLLPGKTIAVGVRRAVLIVPCPVVALRRTRSCFSAFLMWFCSGGNL